jgi:phosphomannomutase
VRFGTSGWRGVLGEDFTFDRARALVRALAERLREEHARPRVVLAHDTRFLGDRLAEAAARVLAGAGVRVVRAAGPLPTPVLTFSVPRRRAAAGLVFTASHNPPEYQGVKVVAPWGGAAPADWTRDLERRTAAILRRGAPPEADPGRRRVELAAPYLDAVLARLDVARIRKSRPALVYDALHGAGAGVLDRLLARAGARVRLRRAAPDPTFGGLAPDPVAARLHELSRAVRARRGARLGLATDGDADRLAVVDADGRILSETDTLALLVDHLARTGRARRGLAISVATGTLAERVAQAHGLPVERHPIGFKHLTEALRAGRADVAGEESGGFAWAPLARDKDGMLAGALLVEALARGREPLAQRLQALRRAHGGGACGRLAVPAPPGDAEAGLARVRRRLPGRVAGARVVEVSAEDGLRLGLADGGFLLLRASGTEPVLRVYAEAPGRAQLARRLAAGARLLRRADAGRGARGRGTRG